MGVAAAPKALQPWRGSGVSWRIIPLCADPRAGQDAAEFIRRLRCVFEPWGPRELGRSQSDLLAWRACLSFVLLIAPVGASETLRVAGGTVALRQSAKLRVQWMNRGRQF